MDKEILNQNLKKCLDKQYQMKFYRHVDDEGKEVGEWKYGSYDSVNKVFSKRYGEMSFFVDQNGFLY